MKKDDKCKCCGQKIPLNIQKKMMEKLLKKIKFSRADIRGINILKKIKKSTETK